ncbi:DUF5694 domain-containing protein [Pelomonas sp. APW6]|uniref:DUF5694 domain-containing protein n=1 Tax=Roseateles subflavus TaxID=3053353 RepID=A0ABT7LH08_9BURK|nr:DUF5694 domain-containing protein [Pelomonas sp. APW6]MDL5032151.1 DUF5694 domain-containing protein [Pelomonas sp. APW6]
MNFRTLPVLLALVAALNAAPIHAQAAAPDAGPATGYVPAFQPGQHPGTPAGAPNQVLVLGTPHLAEFEGQLRQEQLAPLLARLRQWRPQLIAVERLSGLQCDSLRRQPARYADTVKSYCPDVTQAAQLTGLDVVQANEEAGRLLAAWPAQPTPAQRRRLAAVFLAGGESISALVQWLYLPAGERRAGEGLNDALVARLERLRGRASEDSWIAAPLAVEMGLQRVYSVDDHTSDLPDPADTQAQEAAIRQAWDNEAARTRRTRDQALREGLAQAGGVLALYQDCNAPGMPALVYRSDFGAALAEPSPQGYGRAYVGAWETRNLRMVANIREVLAQQPGTRLLTLVGASHKGYYEAYLQQMHDVRLVNPMAVLKD